MPSSLRALGEAGPLPKALGQPRERRLEELERALGRAREHLREHQAGEIEGGREGRGLEVPDRHEALLVDDDKRVRLVRTSSRSTCSAT